MNLEEIKERAKNYYPYQHIDDGFYDNTALFKSRFDIEYLLSRLERYKEALEAIKKFAGERAEINISLETVFYACEEALKEE